MKQQRINRVQTLHQKAIQKEAAYQEQEVLKRFYQSVLKSFGHVRMEENS